MFYIKHNCTVSDQFAERMNRVVERISKHKEREKVQKQNSRDPFCNRCHPVMNSKLVSTDSKSQQRQEHNSCQKGDHLNRG